MFLFFSGKSHHLTSHVTDFEMVQEANKILNLGNLMKGVREFFVLNVFSFSVSELCQKLKENLHNISIMPLEVILGQNEESN